MNVARDAVGYLLELEPSTIDGTVDVTVDVKH